MGGRQGHSEQVAGHHLLQTEAPGDPVPGVSGAVLHPAVPLCHLQPPPAQG